VFTYLGCQAETGGHGYDPTSPLPAWAILANLGTGIWRESVVSGASARAGAPK
jgi:hypothetical protein